MEQRQIPHLTSIKSITLSSLYEFRNAPSSFSCPQQLFSVNIGEQKWSGPNTIPISLFPDRSRLYGRPCLKRITACSNVLLLRNAGNFTNARRPSNNAGRPSNNAGRPSNHPRRPSNNARRPSNHPRTGDSLSRRNQVYLSIQNQLESRNGLHPPAKLSLVTQIMMVEPERRSASGLMSEDNYHRFMVCPRVHAVVKLLSCHTPGPSDTHIPFTTPNM